MGLRGACDPPTLGRRSACSSPLPTNRESQSLAAAAWTGAGPSLWETGEHGAGRRSRERKGRDKGMEERVEKARNRKGR